MPRLRAIHPVALTVGILLTLSKLAAAHDIPSDVTVQSFLKPKGERLNLLVRVPLAAIRDVNFPQRGPGYLDVARAGDLLPDAAMLWIAGAIELYEGDTPLPKPRVAAACLSLESDRSFASYEQALEHVTGRGLPDSTDVHWKQAMLDVWFEYPILSD